MAFRPSNVSSAPDTPVTLPPSEAASASASPASAPSASPSVPAPSSGLVSRFSRGAGSVAPAPAPEARSSMFARRGPNQNPAPAAAQPAAAAPAPGFRAFRPSLASPASPSPAPAAPAAAPASGGGFRTRGVGAEGVGGELAPKNQEQSQVIRPSARHGYERRLQEGVHATRREDGLPLVLDRLIEAVADSRGISAEQREIVKQRSLANPHQVLKKFRELFDAEVAPARRDAQRWAEEIAASPDPDLVRVVLSQDNKYTMRTWDRAEAGPYAMFDGTALIEKNLAETPFARRAEVFTRLAQRHWNPADAAAFDAPADEPLSSPGPSPSM